MGLAKIKKDTHTQILIQCWMACLSEKYLPENVFDPTKRGDVVSRCSGAQGSDCLYINKTLFSCTSCL